MELTKHPSVYILSFVFVLCLITCVEGSSTNITVFDEILVYKPGFPLITISFAPNGTLFSNHGHNINTLVDGTAAAVGDIRPEKKDYYEFEQYYGIAVAPNGTLYASVNDGLHGLIYEVVDGKISNETRIYTRNGTIKEIAFNPNGELFYTDGESIFGPVGGILFNKTFFGGDVGYLPLYISSIAFAPDGTLFVSVTYGYYLLKDNPVEEYSIIWKVVKNNLQLVYVRGRWWPSGRGIDDVAISPDGQIYFDANDGHLLHGNLYKLVPKTYVSLENASFHFRRYPVITNSTVLGIRYNLTSRELELNLTGPKGTLGASTITIFANDFSGELDFEVKLRGQPINHTQVKSQDYIIYFTYDHEEHIPLTLTLKYKSPRDNTWINVTYASIIIIIIAIVTIVTLRKTR